MVPSDPPLLEITARIGATRFKFVIDTGASVSILPSTLANGIDLTPTPISISSASGERISCLGQASLDVKIPCLRRAFQWTFVIADVTKPLLGFDFLNKFGLTIDCKNKSVHDSLTERTVAVHSSTSYVNLVINDVSLPAFVQDLVNTYPSITSPHDDANAEYCGVYHRIDTGSHAPVFAKTRQLSEEKFKTAKNEFQKLINSGVISPSESEWTSPLHMVPKTDGCYRACGDYRALNSCTKSDRYPVPNINSFNSKLAGKHCFSKIDLASAYHQIRVHPDDIPKTAVTTPFGLFEFNNMPFGLKNAAATFQRFMDKIFSKVECVFIYLDDILVFSENEEQHTKDLDQVFRILAKNNLKVSLAKCIFNVPRLDFLGYSVSADGLLPTSNKITQLNSFPYPKDSKGLRRFLGMIGFYRKLIPNYATIVLPLSERMRLFPKCSFELTDQEKQSFDEIVQRLSDITALAHPQPGATDYQLVTDSSQYAVGAALHQLIDGEPIPIGFFSKKLSQAQTKYSTFDRELLASYLAVIHFRHLIEGRQVMLLTDHKPLCGAFHSLNPAKSDRQQRHLSILTEYIADVTHINGDQNVVADCMSRPALAVQLDVCDLPEIAEAQARDEEINGFPDLKDFPVSGDNAKIWCDISNPYPRPFIPVGLRKSIFDSMHSLSHPGIGSTIKLIKSRYFWPNMDKTIKQFCAECVSCQCSKINRHTKSQITNFELPSPRFQTVHIDIVGPLPPVRNNSDPYLSPYRYVLTCIDRATRWIEAQPLMEITAQSVAQAFVSTWIARYGVPLHVVTDRGGQFESELFLELSKIVGFHRLRTTAYHPQCNGLIERAHRTLKTAIIARKESWLSALPIALLGIRSTPNESGYAPFTAVTGAAMLLPQLLVGDPATSVDIPFNGDFTRNLCEVMSQFDLHDFAKGNSHTIPKPYMPKGLMSCEKVWLRVDRVRKSLEAPYTGPYKVLKRSPKQFLIEMNKDWHTQVSVDRLKPYMEPSTNTTNPRDRENQSIDQTSSNNMEPTTVNDILSDTDRDDNKVTKKIGRSSSGRRVTWKKDNDYLYY